MTLKDTLSAGFNSLVNKAGKQIRIKYYTQVIGSVWDDETVLTLDSTTWTSGIVLPINATRGSYESILMEQGKLLGHDQRLYVSGGLTLTGSALQIKIGLGSPPAEEFTIVPEGIIMAEAENQEIYKKVFIRRLTTGSLVGE